MVADDLALLTECINDLPPMECEVCSSAYLSTQWNSHAMIVHRSEFSSLLQRGCISKKWTRMGTVYFVTPMGDIERILMPIYI